MPGYSYEDSLDLDVTPDEAKREIRKHSGDKADAERNWLTFLADVGTKPIYSGEEVLNWLGY